MDISLVVPAFNEEESLPELTAWVKKVMDENSYSFEILFIDDGSKDATWQVIEKLSEEHFEVNGIKFRRNYGKSPALNEGFRMANGDVVITMDADLQDSPDEIPGLYKMIMEEGNDLVSGWKKKRYDPISKTIPSKFFNWVTTRMTGIRLHDFNCGLKSYRRDVVKNIEVYGEMHRYIPMIAKSAGFPKIAEKVVEHRARKYGNTKFGLDRFLKGFLDLLSIMFVSRFGKRPMHLFGTVGTLSFLAGGIIAIGIILDKIIDQARGIPVRDVTDQPLFYLGLVAIIVGVQLFVAGFIAELVSRNSPERNHYKVEKRIGGQGDLIA